MHTCDHDNNVAVDAKVDGIGKTTQKCSPGVAANERVSERVLCNGIDQGVGGGKKLTA
jgi:hypothetical protein